MGCRKGTLRSRENVIFAKTAQTVYSSLLRSTSATKVMYLVGNSTRNLNMNSKIQSFGRQGVKIGSRGSKFWSKFFFHKKFLESPETCRKKIWAKNCFDPTPSWPGPDRKIAVAWQKLGGNCISWKFWWSIMTEKLFWHAERRIYWYKSLGHHFPVGFWPSWYVVHEYMVSMLLLLHFTAWPVCWQYLTNRY